MRTYGPIPMGPHDRIYLQGEALEVEGPLVHFHEPIAHAIRSRIAPGGDLTRIDVDTSYLDEWHIVIVRRRETPRKNS
jgi:hypothetical protein